MQWRVPRSHGDLELEFLTGCERRSRRGQELLGRDEVGFGLDGCGGRPKLLFDAVGSKVPEESDAALSSRAPAARSPPAAGDGHGLRCTRGERRERARHVVPAAQAGVGVTETNVSPAGSGSETATFVRRRRPRFGDGQRVDHLPTAVVAGVGTGLGDRHVSARAGRARERRGVVPRAPDRSPIVVTLAVFGDVPGGQHGRVDRDDDGRNPRRLPPMAHVTVAGPRPSNPARSRLQ